MNDFMEILSASSDLGISAISMAVERERYLAIMLEVGALVSFFIVYFNRLVNMFEVLLGVVLVSFMAIGIYMHTYCILHFPNVWLLEHYFGYSAMSGLDVESVIINAGEEILSEDSFRNLLYMAIYGVTGSLSMALILISKRNRYQAYEIAVGWVALTLSAILICSHWYLMELHIRFPNVFLAGYLNDLAVGF